MTNDTKHPAPTKPGKYYVTYTETGIAVTSKGIAEVVKWHGRLIWSMLKDGKPYFLNLPVTDEFVTWGPRIPEPEELKAMEAELVRLREAARWRKWPQEKPEKDGLYETWLSGGKRSRGPSYSDTQFYYENYGFANPKCVTHWRPIVGPGEESK